MNSLIKIYLMLFWVCGFSGLNGAIGCQSFEHTPDRWDVSVPIYQECGCACRQTGTNKGLCDLCGHYGDPDRGVKTARIFAQSNILWP